MRVEHIFLAMCSVFISLIASAWSDIAVDGGETIQRVAESVASTTSRVGVPYTAKRMVDIYSAAGTLADW